MPGVVCDLGVAARAIKNNRILLVQEAGGSYKGKWSLPKGSVDAGEYFRYIQNSEETQFRCTGGWWS